MKIVHVVESTATGTLSMLSMLADGQSKAGHQVEVIYSRRPETPRTLSLMFSDAVKLHEVQMSGFQHYPTSLALLRRLLHKISPDAIFLHSSFAGFLGRVSIFHTLESSTVYYIPHCISFLRTDIGLLKRLAFLILEKIASLRHSTYIACSASEQQCILRMLPGAKCIVVENAAPTSIANDPDTSENACDTATRVDFTVITVGQIRQQKNPLMFLEISNIVRRAIPDAHFVWVGDGDMKTKERLINAGIIVLGWIPKNQVQTQLSSSDIYLSTSRWEGMPVSIIEAQLAGVPVVASRCPGNSDVVDDGVTGFLFDTPAHAAQRIIEIFSARNTASAVASTAKRRALVRFGEDRYIEEMNRLLPQKT